MRYALVLLNAHAGALIDSGGAHIREQIARSLSQRAERVEIRLLEPKDMPRAIAEAARGEPDTLIVGGGDGSASLAAEALAGGDKLLGVLPFGTMNLFARDLGMPAGSHEAAAMLAEATPRRIDLASVNGRPFHTLSGLGFFSQMARAREETRGHPFGRLLGVGVAAFRALRRAGYFAVEVTAAGQSVQAEALALLVTNNRFEADWRRPQLDAGVLEVHIAEDAGALGRLKATADLISGAWRDSPGIRSIVAPRIRIGHARRRVWAATDGELGRENVPLDYAVMPGALNVLAAS